MGGSRVKKKIGDGWSSDEARSMLKQLGIPSSGAAIAAVMQMDFSARRGRKTEIGEAAGELAEIFLASDPVTSADPTALDEEFSLDAMEKSVGKKELTKKIVKYFLRMEKTYRSDPEPTATTTNPAPAEPTPETHHEDGDQQEQAQETRAPERPTGPAVPAKTFEKAVKAVYMTYAMNGALAAKGRAIEVAQAVAKSNERIVPDALVSEIMDEVLRLAGEEENRTVSEPDTPEPVRSSGGFVARVLQKAGLKSRHAQLLEVATALRDEGERAARKKADTILLVLKHKGFVDMDATVNEFLEFCASLDIPDPDTVAAGADIDAYITDKRGFRKFSDAFVQLAELAETDGEGPALRKAASLVRIFSQDKKVLAPNTPPRVLLDFCRAHQATRRVVDLGAEPEDDHSPDPIDLSGEDPRLPPSFLSGNVKFMQYLYDMQKEVSGQKRFEKILELANGAKAFAQKQMQKEGVGDGDQIDPHAIVKKYFGRQLGMEVSTSESMDDYSTDYSGSASFDSNDPTFVLQREKMKTIDWPAFCALYDFPQDQASVLMDLGILMIKKLKDGPAGNKSVVAEANRLLKARKKTKPKVSIKNARHLLGAIVDAAVKKSNGKPLGSKAITAVKADEWIEMLTPV